MSTTNLKVASRHLLSTGGSTRGTAYSMSNKIVSIGDTLYVSWLDAIGICRIQSMNRKTGDVLERFELGQTELPDNHCGPALVATSDGHLHVIIGSHNRPFRYRKTVRPYDILDWTDEPAFDPHATYPSMVAGPDDTLHLISRAWIPAGRKESCKIAYQNRPSGGQWSEPLAIAQTPSPAGYVHYGANILCDCSGALHVTFHMYHGDPVRSDIQGYLRSENGGVSWTKSDGAVVELPATEETCEVFLRSEDGWLRGGQSSAIDPQGRFYVLVTDQQIRLNSLYRLEGPGHWKCIDLLPQIDRYYPGFSSAQEGMITFDTRGRLYVCLDVKEPSAGWSDPSTEVLLLISDDYGDTFVGMPISDPDPEIPHWLSNMERSTSPAPIEGPPAILHTRGLKGEGCTPDNTTEIHLTILERPGSVSQQDSAD